MIQLNPKWTISVVPTIGVDCNAIVQALASHVRPGKTVVYPSAQRLREMCPTMRKGKLVPMSRERFQAAIKIGRNNNIINTKQTFQKDGSWGRVEYKLTSRFIRVWIDHTDTKFLVSEGDQRDTENRTTPTESRKRDTEKRDTLSRTTESNSTSTITSRVVESDSSGNKKNTKKADLPGSANCVDLADSAAEINEGTPGCAAPPQNEQGGVADVSGIYFSEADRKLAVKIKSGGQPSSAEVKRVMVEYFTETDQGKEEWAEVLSTLETDEESVGSVNEICLTICLKANRYQLRDWRKNLQHLVMSYAKTRRDNPMHSRKPRRTKKENTAGHSASDSVTPKQKSDEPGSDTDAQQFK